MPEAQEVPVARQIGDLNSLFGKGDAELLLPSEDAKGARLGNREIARPALAWSLRAEATRAARYRGQDVDLIR